MERVTLVADPGMLYTDGTIAEGIISLALDRDPSEYYQITIEEYEAIIEKEIA